ncbi:MAG: magnesium transporter [Caldilineaceae bacterium]
MVDPNKYEAAQDTLNDFLESGDFDAAAHVLRGLHPADAAEILSWIEDPDQQAEVVRRMQTDELADVFEQMYEEDMADVAEHLDRDTLVDVLDQMEPDAAADLLGEMEPDEAAELIEEMDEPESVTALLKYPEETAGGIMNLPPPSLRRWMKVREAVTFLREHYQDAEDIYYLYVLDRNGRLIGIVNLRAMVLADPDQTIETIMRTNIVTVRADADQEEAAGVLARYDLLAVPVVDHDDRLVGIISVDDLVDVLEEEATEDIYRLAQVSDEGGIWVPVSQALRGRLPWLMVNTFTAFLASSVVSLFDATIAQATVLAALMPIVAGQGGNAGTQSLTVVVRSLALREVEPADAASALWHEARVGMVNGLVLGILVGSVVALVTREPVLGMVIAIAMLGNMVVAATFGTLVPLTLRRLGVDPALASSIFVTTATDVLGFFIFLGLATIFLEYIV